MIASNKEIGMVGGVFVLWLGFVLSIVFFKLWLIGSVITSGVKSMSDDCGRTYGVPVVSQDWFCSEGEE